MFLSSWLPGFSPETPLPSLDRKPGITSLGARLTVSIRAALLLLSFFALLSSAPTTTPVFATGEVPAVTGTPAVNRSEILVGTVHSVDSASGTLSLLTGRGHALRVVQVSLPRGAAIMRKGTALPLSDLKPGVIVRVRFTREKAGEIQQASEVEVQESGR
jgi:hypothetical protein